MSRPKEALQVEYLYGNAIYNPSGNNDPPNHSVVLYKEEYVLAHTDLSKHELHNLKENLGKIVVPPSARKSHTHTSKTYHRLTLPSEQILRKHKKCYLVYRPKYYARERNGKEHVIQGPSLSLFLEKRDALSVFEIKDLDSSFMFKKNVVFLDDVNSYLYEFDLNAFLSEKHDDETNYITPIRRCKFYNDERDNNNNNKYKRAFWNIKNGKETAVK